MLHPNNQFPHRKRNQSGSAVLVVLILISVMTVYLVANVVSLNILKKEIQLIEKAQLKRQNQSVSLEKPSIGTNSNVTSKSITNEVTKPKPQ